MKAILLVVTAIGMLALLALGTQLIGGAVEDLPDDVANSSEANATAGSVTALMGGASAVPWALLIGAICVVFYGMIRMVDW